MSKIRDSKILKFPTNITEAEKQIEAILFAAEEPLDEESIQENTHQPYIQLIILLTMGLKLSLKLHKISKE